MAARISSSVTVLSITAFPIFFNRINLKFVPGFHLLIGFRKFSDISCGSIFSPQDWQIKTAVKHITDLIKSSMSAFLFFQEIYAAAHRTPVEEMVIRTCSIKKMVVEKDPTEQGDRALLNLGHTIGHAIEKAKNFELYHGECVALGTVAAAYISWKKEMLSMEEFYEIRDMFVPFYLPISVDDIDPQEILKLTKSDKKMEAGKIKFILLKKIGKAVIDRTVTDDEILAAIEEINFSEEDAHE